ncbi:MAG: hypothetical protein N4A44_03105 [Alphaproteobacteria bacterium]|nr:hypothetical protein [Alphaproteobacteria bacterium]
MDKKLIAEEEFQSPNMLIPIDLFLLDEESLKELDMNMTNLLKNYSNSDDYSIVIDELQKDLINFVEPYLDEVSVEKLMLIEEIYDLEENSLVGLKQSDNEIEEVVDVVPSVKGIDISDKLDEKKSSKIILKKYGESYRGSTPSKEIYTMDDIPENNYTIYFDRFLSLNVKD